MFKVQRIKNRSRRLNFLYIMIKEMVGKVVKNDRFYYLYKSFDFK